MTLLITLLSIIGYCFITTILLYLIDKFIDYEDFALFAALSIMWPVGIPIMILILIVRLFIKLFEKLFD